MLAIRLQRTGRKGHAQFRMVVQDSRRTPSSGRVVASLGSFNPHTKETTVDFEQAKTFLTNGAQPSERVARILKANGVDLPAWVKLPEQGTKSTKNPEKLRKNQPKEETPVVEETSAEEAPSDEAPAPEAVAEEVPVAEDAKAESEEK